MTVTHNKIFSCILMTPWSFSEIVVTPEVRQVHRLRTNGHKRSFKEIPLWLSASRHLFLVGEKEE
jgi:hypothetical protein